MSALTLSPEQARHREESQPRRMAAPPRPALLRLWLGRITARRALAALHPEQIREAGLDPIRVHAESLKPFWRA